MGTDIHVLFEVRRGLDQPWELLFPCQPDPKYWYEGLVEDRVNNGAAFVLSGGQGTDDEDAEKNAYAAATAYFEAIPLDEAVARYGDDPRFIWSFGLPADQRTHFRITQRDYRWFGFLAGLRGGTPKFEVRGIPEDACFRVKQWLNYWKSDGHSHSWLMVDEILAADLTHADEHAIWFTKYISDPANTRMVFFFDN